MNHFSPFIKESTAVIQVTALMLLQLYSIFPAFGHFVAPPKHGAACRGDHRLCGCPLDRIANRTCCCFKSLEMARNLMEHHKKEFMPNSDIKRLARFACPPCGNQSDFISPSLENFKFLRLEAASEAPHLLWLFNLSESGDTYQTRSKEPPDPPPRSITS
jgi:hypothetical protein